MNKTMRYLDYIKCMGLLLMLPLAFGSCTDVWNSHYDMDNQKQIADKTLWEEIASRPELQGFADCLKQYGYDEVLDGDQIYTIFAPQGTIDVAGLTENKVKEEVLNNHIARFTHSANGATVDKDVMMLNEKLINFTKVGDDYTFGDATLTGMNIIAKNGVLHIISEQVPFFFNVWEYLTTDSAFSGISKYMYSFDEKELDEESSVEGPIVNGLQTYVDSVVVTYNMLHYMLGELNNEDSTYTMILPTNKAWNAAYARIAPYYTYHKKHEFRDSLQEYYTKLGIVKDLIFSHTMQGDMQDSLLSTSGNVFYNPFDYLLTGYSSYEEGVVCSNGKVFVTDSLYHNPWDSWHSRLKIEGERVNGHAVKESTTIEYRRNLKSTDSLYTKVSGREYLELVPKQSSSATEIDFNIWNTLAATYDIKVVFLPQQMATDRSIGIKPNHLAVSLSYLDDQGRTKKTNLAVAKDSLLVDPYKIDTVHVGTFTFPVSTYGEEKSSITLNVKSAASSRDKTKSRTMLIDCVILEPVKE